MTVIILAGGKGTRLAEITERTPKAMICLNGDPILWHIMKYFSCYGHKDFVLCTGYMANKIERYIRANAEDTWNITCVDSGVEATKSQRLTDASAVVQGDRFFIAYGDDLGDVDLDRVVRLNEQTGKTVTLTCVRPQSPFGVLRLDGNGDIAEFREKCLLNHWINGGYMVARQELFGYLGRGELETEVFTALVRERKINAYKHTGFWRSMNTFKDFQMVEEMCRSGQMPWRKWRD